MNNLACRDMAVQVIAILPAKLLIINNSIFI
jgi:hypothetical protein